ASIPVELERVVLHALVKKPSERPRNADELRSELHATADELGLEHSDSTHIPTLDDLRSAGTESPSGRLVIDLATLRQVQASSGSLTIQEPPQNLSKPSPQPRAPENVRPEFNRVRVPLERQPSRRSQLIVLALFLLIVIVGSGVIAARWWRGVGPGFAGAANSNVARSPSPTPTASPSPSPSPTPTAKPVKSPERHKEKEASGLKKVWNKVKGIFR
ncbi:MAG TPA: hypothetical protein VFU37_16210, partial [Pyrinomonadaceae bacterium]|nr:hypothetical protein [Pyrinomonadaceae bacterium]